MFPRGKGWKRMLASALQPPACPILSIHNSHPQLALGSLNYSFIPSFMPLFQGAPRMNAISYKKPSLLPPVWYPLSLRLIF